MQPRPLAPSDQADLLAASGRVPEAILLLNRLAAANDGAALFKLGIWRLEGRLLPRDLTASRDFFRRAAEAGRADAAAIHAAFVANGTGGPSDWPRALALLEKLASKDQAAKRQLELIGAMTLTAAGDPVSVPEGETLSNAPRVVLFPRLFTAAECKYLIETAEPLFTPAVVVDPATGRQIQNPVRTSDGAMFPWVRESPAIHALNRRTAAISGTDVAQGEPLQVLRYRPGQQYKPHFDAVPGLDNQRVMTVLVYLNDNYQGGETEFPKTGLKVKGKRGDALLFRNVGDDGRADDSAMHAGLPVKSGMKLLYSRWIRARPLEVSNPQRIA